MVRISRRLVPVLWLSLIASPRCNNRPRAPTSSPLRMVCRQQWNHTIHVDQRHSLNNAKQLKNVSRKLWSLVRNCNRPFPSFRVPLFWCSGRDAWLCGHWEMWKKLFRSYGNVYYVGYHIGGSRGTVERECNEIVSCYGLQRRPRKGIDGGSSYLWPNHPPGSKELKFERYSIQSCEKSVVTFSMN